MGFTKFHQPCTLCDSTDACSINEDGSAHCFSCNSHIKNYYGGNVEDLNTFKTNKFNDIPEGVFIDLIDRNIKKETAKKYGVKGTLLGMDVDRKVTHHYYPYFIANERVGTKIRDCKLKEFVWRGSSKGVLLFGQQLFSKGGKYLTICEGECDAMAAYELLGSKWPVVSVKNGAGGSLKDIKENLEFVESFDQVVINFDNDAAGREAAEKVARLLKPGKAKLLNLPEDFKDANDILKKGQAQEYVTAWWAAKKYTPAGVLNVTDMSQDYFDRTEYQSVPYPWQGLNEKLYGMRQGELITFTGGTGLGKSSVTRELEHWLLKNTEDNIGILALEESWHKTIDCLVSIEANKRLYIKEIREAYPEESWRGHFNTLFKGPNLNRLWIHSHLGEHDIEELFSKLRYMILGCDCKWIIIDHLGMMTSALADGDERRTIDNIMTRLRALVEETSVGMMLVSHLKKSDGPITHEQGKEVAISDMRGSNSIGQISDCVIALERNMQSNDSDEAATTRLRVLKSRYTGDVGLASYLLYDTPTGRLKEIFTDEKQDEEELEF